MHTGERVIFCASDYEVISATGDAPLLSSTLPSQVGRRSRWILPRKTSNSTRGRVWMNMYVTPAVDEEEGFPKLGFSVGSLYRMM